MQLCISIQVNGPREQQPVSAVSDSPYPREAFSIGEERDGENAVEGPVQVEDMDECLIYEGNICHQRCVNTPGSFRCECFPGYVLQEDAFTCAPGRGNHAHLSSRVLSDISRNVLLTGNDPPIHSGCKT